MTRVLVVDDKEENLYYLSSLLGAHGFAVERAHHGAEALALARRTPPTLVVSDLLMPVMDGYTLLRHWRADDALQSIPFIVYTATYTEPEDEQLARDLGADEFILKPSDPERFMQKLRAVLAREPPAPITRSQPPGDDDQLARFEQYSATLIRKLEEKTLELEASNQRLVRDVDARERTAEALRESELRFRQLAETIEDVFWLSELDGRFIYVSPMYDTVWGRPRSELFERASVWRDSVHPADRPPLDRVLGRWHGGPTDETFRIVRPDGSVRWIRARAFPVKDGKGTPYRIAGVARDITDYRRLEDQFRQAQKLEAIGRLAGGVAHDFNNLLSIILSYTSLILDGLDPNSRERADLLEVKRASERAAALTRQLLAFSRQQVLDPKVLDLNQVVLDLEKMLRRLLGEDVALSIVTAPTASKVYADPTQLEQILLNIAVNARDAMPNGGQLTVEVSQVELSTDEIVSRPGLEPGAHVLLSITDTGVGMDAATRERVFEPFFTTKEVGKGTGLGLATVFGIVSQSRGHIELASELERGTTFKIYLPCTRRPLPVAVLGQRSTEPLRGGETILLVEDDDRLRAVNRLVLERHGYHVLDAQNGGEAFLTSEKYDAKIDLLLTDVVMPRMNGRELAERLAQSRPEMKVLYVSGYTQDAVVHQGTLEPGVNFLQKPTTPFGLLSRVRELLDETPAAPAAD